MPIDKKQIEHLADLARLGVTESEKEKYSEQISDILDYFDQLREVDTKEVAPLSHVFELSNITRKDKNKKICSPEELIAEAPETEKRQIKIKSVLGKKT